MKELYVFCEGATEQEFCRQLLGPHLFPEHDGVIRPVAIEHSKHHGRVARGGVPGRYETMRRDIANHLKSRKQRNVLFTTQIDLYGLPKDFPGKKTHRRNTDNPTFYVTALERAFEDNIGDPRFIAHLQLYEYETLLFADPEVFQLAFDNCDRAIEELKKIAASFPTIEHIDDGPITRPVEAHHPSHTGLRRPETDGRTQDRRGHRPARDPREMPPFRRMADPAGVTSPVVSRPAWPVPASPAA